MPAPGSKLKYGNRNYIYNTDFFKKNLVEDKKTKLSYKDCKNIINVASKNIAGCITDEIDGFKLPFGLGYIVASKFIPKNPAIDWKKSNESGVRVYHNNLHTFGYSVGVKWFRVGRIQNANFHEVFKIVTYKTLSQSVSKAFGSGSKPYSEWCMDDFIQKSRLENMYSKKYRKKELKQI